MTFADEFVIPVLEGEKTATVRQSGTDIHMNNVVTAITEHGVEFAKLNITRTAELQAVEAHDFIQLVGGKHSTESEEDMLSTLNQYYPGIRPGSQVKVFVFERLDGGV